MPPGLVYSSDTQPGIRRVRRGAKAFAYRDAKGAWLRDEGELARIRKLAIPPAYEDVWICANPNGHLQATGRDARGRKQYRYHPRFRESREDHKFDRLLHFGMALPRIRQRVAHDLAPRPGEPLLARSRVLATIVRLLDTTFLRVGNDEYARGNGSYGLTTMRNEHAGVRGSTVKLRFRGKHGVLHEAELDDPRVAKVVRRCQHMPGQELFSYVDEDGTPHGVGSGDVNDYLDEAAGERFTAKDFRTWHGSVQALALTCAACVAHEQSRQEAARALERRARSTAVQIVAEVAQQLGNTPAVCRKAYIHPDVLALAMGSDEQRAHWAGRDPGQRARLRGLQRDERRLLHFLQQLARTNARRGAAGKSALEGALQDSLKAARRSSRAARPASPSGKAQGKATRKAGRSAQGM